MSEGTDTRYFSQIQTVCHPATEWHTAHLWATHTLVPTQNMPDFFRYESKLEIARIAGQSDTKKSSQIQMACNLTTTVARRCTPLSYRRALKLHADVAVPPPSGRHCDREVPELPHA